MRAISNFFGYVYHFLVDSPLLAILALAALAIAGLLSLIGAAAVAGWLLFVLVAGALGADLSRAMKPKATK